VWKPEERRQLGRTRNRFRDNIKMNFHEVGYRVMEGASWLRRGRGGGYLEMK